VREVVFIGVWQASNYRRQHRPFGLLTQFIDHAF
jgi:hypothetical protein